MFFLSPKHERIKGKMMQVKSKNNILKSKNENTKDRK